MFKNIQVVMLPTKEKAEIQLAIDNTLRFTSNHTWIYQHLYFLSDEKLKEGEWSYDVITKKIFKSEYEGTFRNWKKVIATTDSSIRIGQEDIHSRGISYYPQLSQEFLEVFVKEYNKGNQIKEVVVEYEDRMTDLVIGRTIQILKTNSKDNTITIRRIKDSWNREEVANLLYSTWNHAVEVSHATHIKTNDPLFKDWLEQKL